MQISVCQDLHVVISQAHGGRRVWFWRRDHIWQNLMSLENIDVPPVISTIHLVGLLQNAVISGHDAI